MLTSGDVNATRWSWDVMQCSAVMALESNMYVCMYVCMYLPGLAGTLGLLCCI